MDTSLGIANLKLYVIVLAVLAAVVFPFSNIKFFSMSVVCLVTGYLPVLLVIILDDKHVNKLKSRCRYSRNKLFD